VVPEDEVAPHLHVRRLVDQDADALVAGVGELVAGDDVAAHVGRRPVTDLDAVLGDDAIRAGAGDLVALDHGVGATADDRDAPLLVVVDHVAGGPAAARAEYAPVRVGEAELDTDGRIDAAERL